MCQNSRVYKKFLLNYFVNFFNQLLRNIEVHSHDQMNMTKVMKMTNINLWVWPKFNSLLLQQWTLTCEYDRNNGEL